MNAGREVRAMLSIGRMRDGWDSDMGCVYLRLMLIAALFSPLAAVILGRRIATPFRVPLAVVAAAAALATLCYAGWRVRGAAGRGALRGLVDLATVGGLAAAFALIIGWRATGFYSQEALADAMAVLLSIHLAGAALRAVGVRRQRWPSMTVLGARSERGVAHVSEPASMQFADALTADMALLVAGFWGLAALGLHEAAGILLLLAGLAGTIAFVARVPSAIFNERVLLRRWRRGRRSRRGGALAPYGGSDVHSS